MALFPAYGHTRTSQLTMDFATSLAIRVSSSTPILETASSYGVPYSSFPGAQNIITPIRLTPWWSRMFDRDFCTDRTPLVLASLREYVVGRAASSLGEYVSQFSLYTTIQHFTILFAPDICTECLLDLAPSCRISVSASALDLRSSARVAQLSDLNGSICRSVDMLSCALNLPTLFCRPFRPAPSNNWWRTIRNQTVSFFAFSYSPQVIEVSRHSHSRFANDALVSTRDLRNALPVAQLFILWWGIACRPTGCEIS